MMQLVLFAHQQEVELCASHVVRELNGWADQLANGNSDGFAFRLQWGPNRYSGKTGRYYSIHDIGLTLFP